MSAIITGALLTELMERLDGFIDVYKYVELNYSKILQFE